MHITLRRYRTTERGDTLVEVLIAIAVVSLVLGGAYVVTNRSLLATRAAQERSVALKLAEAQVEQIKALASSETEAQLLFGPSAPAPFCIAKASGQPVVADNFVSGSTGDAACTVGTSGDPSSTEPRFRISVTRSGNTFTLQERWENVGGRQTDQLQLRYRVYE
jgi:prepilin-type N-terminal cleavage/methylation domain-containing protein